MSHSGCEMGSFVRRGEKVTTAKQTENSRRPSQNLAPERECTRVPLGDEKCFPWAVHHHRPPQRQLPHLGHISPEGRGWALGIQCCPGFFEQPLLIDGLGLHASPGWSCSMAGRRGGQGALDSQWAAEECTWRLQVTMKTLADLPRFTVSSLKVESASQPCYL